MYATHCDWVDVLIVRGRCFRSSKISLRANRALENLLWNWSSMRRPYVVFTGGRSGIRYVDPIPAWLERERVYHHLCQCHLLGPRHAGWHRHGSLYSNVVRVNWEMMWSCRLGCCKQRPFPEGCTKNTMNTEIATKHTRVVIHA